MKKFILPIDCRSSTVNTDMKFSGTDPIYIQIANYFKKLIHDGVFQKGDAIPSVRDFGSANGVNPNTVARSYEILVNEEIIVSLPKKGYFVNDECKFENTEKDYSPLERKLRTILDEGYSKEEIIDVLNDIKEGDKWLK